jgi:hypothetical protein
VLIGHQFAHLHQLSKRALFPHHGRIGHVRDDVEDPRLQHEEAAIDQVLGHVRFLDEIQHAARHRRIADGRRWYAD